MFTRSRSLSLARAAPPMNKRLRANAPPSTSLQDIPLEVLLMMFTETPGVPTNLHELVTRLRNSGFTKGARFIEQHMGQPGFWRNLTRQCFPLVTQLPSHIEEWLRGGKRYYNVPDDVVMPITQPRSATSQAWRDAFRHILGVLNSMHTRVLRATGVEYPSSTLVANSGFAPPLALPHTSIETCDTYVNHAHEVSVTYGVDEEAQAPFTFYLNMSSRGTDEDEQGMSDDELELGVEYDELPVLGNMGNQVGGNATVAALLNRSTSSGGAFVYRGVVRVPKPFDGVISADYEVRWKTKIPQLSERFARIVPPALKVRAVVDARLVVQPWRIDDRFLFAVDARQVHPRSTRVRTLGTPVRWLVDTYTNGVLSQTVFDETLPARFRLAWLWRDGMLKLATVHSTAMEAAIHFDVDTDWAPNGTVSQSLHIDSSTRELYKKTLLIEIIGPVRPMRPVPASAPEAAWFPDVRRKSHVTIHVRV